MRKVTFTVYEQLKPNEKTRGNVEYTGLFHQWGLEIEEDENGFSSYTVGIVELENGVIKTPLPSQMKFINT